MLVDDHGLDRLGLAQPVQLDHQAFLQVAGADTNGMKRLDSLQRLLQFVQRQARTDGQFLNGRVQITVVVDAADQEFGNLAFLGVSAGKIELLNQVLLQRLLLHDRVEEMLALFLLFGRARPEAAGLGKVFAPFIVQLREHLEFFFEFLVLFRCVGGAGGRLAIGTHLDAGFVLGHFFQERILLEFFVDQRAQLECRHLQQMKALLQLRSKDLLQ